MGNLIAGTRPEYSNSVKVASRVGNWQLHELGNPKFFNRREIHV